MSQGWQDVAEKGASAGIALLVAVATGIGRRMARALLVPIAWWFVLLHADVRRASRDYLRRVLPGQVGVREVYRHVRTFAEVALDRIYLVRGEIRRFRMSSTGEELVEALSRGGRGGILLLAHLGSYDGLRAWSSTRGIRVSAIGDFRNARMFTAALRRMNPEVDVDLIQVEDDARFILSVAERVGQGGLVAVMGDRVAPGERRVECDFLGGRAAFPAGPYLIAATLGCPIYLVYGLYREPNRYELHCEPFAERVELPRGEREEGLARLAQRYATRLEQLCRQAPYNWFNFYDFWSVPR
ncbi:MAG TPA: hypothetical protein VMT17_06235 [Anaeromyxobacteraceae bacterium]|nr:hypothetical protein [Anaeromyxobacteraceae bacterium]